jgi:hypothetical protein
MKRLKEIEKLTESYRFGSSNSKEEVAYEIPSLSDIDWLINRVKRLTEALERIKVHARHSQ